MERYEEALTDFNRAIELDPTDAWSFYRLALIRRAQGSDDDAHALLQSAIDIGRASMRTFPAEGTPALNVIVYLLAAGRYAEAETELRTTLHQELNSRDVREAIRDINELKRLAGEDLGLANVLSLLMEHGSAPMP
jgi:tetratricopeptide (TPR) repeat protein